MNLNTESQTTLFQQHSKTKGTAVPDSLLAAFLYGKCYEQLIRLINKAPANSLAEGNSSLGCFFFCFLQIVVQLGARLLLLIIKVVSEL